MNRPLLLNRMWLPSILRFCALVGLYFALILVAVTPARAEGVGRLVLHSSPGEFIGGGKDYDLSSDRGWFEVELRDFTRDGLVDYIGIHYHDGTNSFDIGVGTDPLGTNLAPGSYPDTEGVFSPSHAILDVAGQGHGCSDPHGSFTVERLSIDYSGASPRLADFALSFQQQCGASTAVLSGTLTCTDTPSPLPHPDLAGDWQRLRVRVAGTGAHRTWQIEGWFEVRNIGNQAAGSTTVEFMLWDVGTPRSLLQVRIPPLGVQETRSIHWSVSLPHRSKPNDLDQFLAYLDTLKELKESDTTNNIVWYLPGVAGATP